MATGGVPASVFSEAEKRKKILTCSLCLGIFASPKILPCFHTFCLICLQQLIKSLPHPSSFLCPICRRETFVPPGGVKEYQTNFYLLEADLAKEQGEVEPCPIHPQQILDLSCSDCQQPMCRLCTETRHCQPHAMCSAIAEATCQLQNNNIPCLRKLLSKLTDRAAEEERRQRAVEQDEAEAEKAIWQRHKALVANATAIRDESLEGLRVARVRAGGGNLALRRTLRARDEVFQLLQRLEEAVRRGTGNELLMLAREMRERRGSARVLKQMMPSSISSLTCRPVLCLQYEVSEDDLPTILRQYYGKVAENACGTVIDLCDYTVQGNSDEFGDTTEGGLWLMMMMIKFFTMLVVYSLKMLVTLSMAILVAVLLRRMVEMSMPKFHPLLMTLIVVNLMIMTVALSLGVIRGQLLRIMVILSMAVMVIESVQIMDSGSLKAIETEPLKMVDMESLTKSGIQSLTMVWVHSLAIAVIEWIMMNMIELLTVHVVQSLTRIAALLLRMMMIEISANMVRYRLTSMVKEYFTVMVGESLKQTIELSLTMMLTESLTMMVTESLRMVSLLSVAMTAVYLLRTTELESLFMMLVLSITMTPTKSLAAMVINKLMAMMDGLFAILVGTSLRTIADDSLAVETLKLMTAELLTMMVVLLLIFVVAELLRMTMLDWFTMMVEDSFPKMVVDLLKMVVIKLLTVLVVLWMTVMAIQFVMGIATPPFTKLYS